MTHPSTTIVTCIEAGPLEQQVVLLAKSLRMQSGRFSGSDIIAIAPRRGPSISRETKNMLSRLKVELVKENVVKSYGWFSTYNKPAAMAFIESRTQTTYLTWMDGDIVVMDNLDELIPSDGSDFLCRAGESPLGSNGKDGDASYWKKLAEITGINYRTSDLIDSLPQRSKIYEYYQSGVYTYRRTTGIGRRQAELFEKVVQSGIGSASSGTYHHDQATLSLAAIDCAPKRQRLAWRYNYNFNMSSPEKIDPEMLPSLAVLHYHGSFHPEQWDRAESFFTHLPDETVALIRENAPFVATRMGPVARLYRRALRGLRERRMDAYRRTVQIY